MPVLNKVRFGGTRMFAFYILTGQPIKVVRGVVYGCFLPSITRIQAYTCAQCISEIKSKDNIIILFYCKV